MVLDRKLAMAEGASLIDAMELLNQYLILASRRSL